MDPDPIVTDPTMHPTCVSGTPPLTPELAFAISVEI